MIWNAQEVTETSKGLVLSRIMSEIRAVCGDEDVHPDEIEEIARSVAMFLERQHLPYCVESKYLVLLASRALSSLGERKLARRLLVFGTGLVTSSEWIVTGQDAMLVLDLKRLTVRDSDCMELLLFELLTTVVEAVADVWDESGGRGVMGLRSVCWTSARLLGCRGKSRHARRLAEEIKTFCARKLDGIGQARGWKSSPLVMNLDA